MGFDTTWVSDRLHTQATVCTRPEPEGAYPREHARCHCPKHCEGANWLP